MSFSNKVVIVTGSSAGIGESAVIQFTKEGAYVTIVGRNEAKLAKLAEECAKYGKKPLVIKGDISKDEDAPAVVTRTIETFGRIYVLVNNAGIYFSGDIVQPTFMEVFDSIINVNLRATVLITNLATPHIIKTKENIINISSVLGTSVKIPNHTSYKTSKE